MVFSTVLLNKFKILTWDKSWNRQENGEFPSHGEIGPKFTGESLNKDFRGGDVYVVKHYF